MTSSTRKFGAHRYPDGLGELRLMPDVIDGLALAWLRSVLVEREVGRGAVIVEAVGIEPCCQRYANPTRTLGFPAYRCERNASPPLTPAPGSTLESACLPCALGMIWSFSVFGSGEHRGTGALTRSFNLVV
jgi:hypothetical protein